MTADKNLKASYDNYEPQLDSVDRNPVSYSNAIPSGKQRKESANSGFKKIGIALLHTIIFFILVYLVSFILPDEIVNNLTFLAVTLSLGGLLFLWRSSRE
ncbi:hypothetical protein ACYSNU_07685 [Enterococcus sp. LJL120]